MAAKRRREGTTVNDVARLAGVSPITVSRALNAPAQLSAATLERVRGAIRSTGYVPNLLAGGLRSAKSRLVAAVVPTITGPVFLDTIQALTDALDARGYQLMIGQSGYRDSREDALLDAIIGRRPTGIVLTGMMRSPEGRKRLINSGIPIVETWDLTPTPIDMLVGFSHERIGEAVAEYLHGRGRRRPAVISGDDPRAARRTAGFTQACRKLGIAAAADPGAIEWVPAPTTLAAGRAALARLLERDPGIDAVFASSDLLAWGVITEARARGLEIPARLGVVGFGDLQLLAGVTPSMTTVRIDGARMGRMAATFIIDRSEGREIAERVVDVGFSIVPRESA
jgi:LacI family gluconate utilization system Gnt-I transcriptional repressor